MKILSSDEFINVLNEGIIEDGLKNIDFNDEIVSIKSVGNRRTFDINVQGNDHFFYANDILTHNSATGNQVDFNNVNNDSVSDSLGTVQTADFIMFLLQNEKMKAENLMTCKVTKNRFNGRTDFWNMNIDYTKMRFRDAPVEGEIGAGMAEDEISKTIKTIAMEDIKTIKKADAKLKLEDDFGSSKTGKIQEDFDLNSLLGLS